MPKLGPENSTEAGLLKVIEDLRKLGAAIDELNEEKLSALRQELSTKRRGWLNKHLDELWDHSTKLERFIKRLTPAKIEEVQITLGRADNIAKYFAFVFVNQDRYPLSALASKPFYGSGIYAIYYVGSKEPAYSRLAGAETPLYLGKADPRLRFAEGSRQQGQSLYSRLVEHSKSILGSGLDLSEFEYRFATVQSGMQAAVEDFLIRLFRPIWNKEIQIAFGIGKHGDAAETRANRRSPWDTMHPGRKWARATKEDQASRNDVIAKISSHLERHPPFANRDQLLAELIKS